jgi:acetylornithine deacetylase/succinyl-diaminopimelate desuccinylase-like protein
MLRTVAGMAISLMLLAGGPAGAQAPAPGLLREIYQELVEIDTSDATGDTTRAAEAMAARLRAGGLAPADVQVIVPPGGPKKGNLVARLRGTGAKKPLLLLAHIDTVNAKREDWQRDPFKLIEENGYFHARGAADNKAMAAALVSIMIELKQQNARPERDLIIALTADEEIIPSQFSGIEYLIKNHRPLIDAELALNEGGGGLFDKNGKPLYHGIQAGEKVFQTYRLEVTNPGGHSARPSKDNAIYHLAAGLARLAEHDFPFKLLPVTRSYFERAAAFESGQMAADMKGILTDPPDAQALARIGNAPRFNALIRTTCVATMLDAGHATNALPQRARAVVNCRVLPGESVDEVQKTLARVLANDKISIAPDGAPVLSPPPPLTPEIMRPVNEITASLWPGVPVVPTLSAGATDGRFLANIGIPTYGITGQFRDADGNGVHGLNERIRVKSFYEGHQFLNRLIRALAAAR